MKLDRTGCRFLLLVGAMMLLPEGVLAAEPRFAQTTLDQIVENNLLANGDFRGPLDEAGLPTGWTFSEAARQHFQVEAPQGLTGSRHLKLVGGGRGIYTQSAPFPVEAGRAYTLTLRARQEGQPDWAKDTRIYIWWTTSEHRRGYILEQFRAGEDWRRHTHGLVAPEGAVSATISISKSNNIGTLWLDQIALAPGVVPGGAGEPTGQEAMYRLATFAYLKMRLERSLVFRERWLSQATREQLHRLMEQLDGEIRRVEEAHPALAEIGTEAWRHLYNEQTVYRGALAFQPSPAERWYERWEQLAEQWASLDAAIWQELRTHRPKQIRREIQAVYGQEARYGASAVASLQKVFRDEPLLSPVSREVSVALAGHEYESVQVVVLPLDEPLEGVTVSLSSLVSAEGAVLDASHLQWQPVGFVETHRPDYPVDYVGWWPDPLLPTGPFEVPVGRNQPVWITVYAPAGQPAGLYRGAIQITPTNAPAIALDLAVQVWGFDLPVKGQFKVLDRFNLGQLNQYYGWKAAPREILEAWHDFLIARRFPGTEIYSTRMQPDASFLPRLIRQGMNAINLTNASFFVRKDGQYHVPSQEEAARIQAAVREGAEAVRGHGGEGIGYVYAFDEVHDRTLYPAIRQVAELVKAADSSVRFATTTTYEPIAPLVGAVDTWVPLLGKYTDEIEARRLAGDEVFFYIYSHPLHPFPNAANIDYPALDGRISFWIASNMGWSGFLHWLSNGWRANVVEAGQRRWPEIPWKPYHNENHKGRRNGEGYFLYPGPAGQPLSSIRFEMMRDGIEDWEMLAMLRDLRRERAEAADANAKWDSWLRQADQALARARALAPLDFQFDPDPEELLATRQAVAEALQAGRDPRERP